MPQIGFTKKQSSVFRRFNDLRRAYEDANGGGRVYNPDFLSVLLDAFEERQAVYVAMQDIASASVNSSGLSNIDPRIGKQVRCLYGNSGNKFYSDFLDTLPVIRDVRKNGKGKPDSFKLGEDWWYCNDFEILEPQNETK